MYCTATDIINELTPNIAAQLSYSTVPLHPDEEYIEAKIVEADGYIDSYLAGSYKLPLKKTHLVLKILSIELTCYLLKKQRQASDKLEGIRQSIDERLQKIVDGVPVLIGEERLELYMTETNTIVNFDSEFWKGYDA